MPALQAQTIDGSPPMADLEASTSLTSGIGNGARAMSCEEGMAEPSQELVDLLFDLDDQVAGRESVDDSQQVYEKMNEALADESLPAPLRDVRFFQAAQDVTSATALGGMDSVGDTLSSIVNAPVDLAYGAWDLLTGSSTRRPESAIAPEFADDSRGLMSRVNQRLLEGNNKVFQEMMLTGNLVAPGSVEAVPGLAPQETPVDALGFDLQMVDFEQLTVEDELNLARARGEDVPGMIADINAGSSHVVADGLTGAQQWVADGMPLPGGLSLGTGTHDEGNVADSAVASDMGHAREWAKAAMGVKSLDFGNFDHRRAIGKAMIHVKHGKSQSDYLAYMKANPGSSARASATTP